MKDTKHRPDQSRDELLSRYEAGVWTYFLAVIGFALFGMVVWIGLLVLQLGEIDAKKRKATPH